MSKKFAKYGKTSIFPLGDNRVIPSQGGRIIETGLQFCYIVEKCTKLKFFFHIFFDLSNGLALGFWLRLRFRLSFAAFLTIRGTQLMKLLLRHTACNSVFLFFFHVLFQVNFVLHAIRAIRPSNTFERRLFNIRHGCFRKVNFCPMWSRFACCILPVARSAEQKEWLNGPACPPPAPGLLPACPSPHAEHSPAPPTQHSK